jgi:D-3-phosphoglycerate dehydrogenase
MKILISDPLSTAAIAVLQAESGWETIVNTADDFVSDLVDADALIVRSSTKVTRRILAKAPKLRAIGRAGIGVDNVDTAAATEQGIVVMNTPGGNAISVAEHTLALMLALARMIAQANASTKAGKWEKSKFLGSELNGKTLGIVGFGNIGIQVAMRAQPLGMEVIAHDPFVSQEVARDRGVQLVARDELFSRSDYVTLHLPVTAETENFLDDKAFAGMKDGIRIVNCARGELIDADALARALDDGKVSGAALDVFPEEPPPASSSLLSHPNVIATPHIGGATAEAQEIVGIRIAEQIRDYLKNGVITNAVNMPSISAEQYGKLKPFLDLALRLGSFVAQVATGQPRRVTILYSGNFEERDAVLIRNAALAGILNRFLSQKANLINAAQVAATRGLGVSEVRRRRTLYSDSLTVILKTEHGETKAEGTVFADQSPRLINVDGIHVEAPLDGHMVFAKNHDVPGVIGQLGTILGNNHINIADFCLGRREDTVKSPGPAEAVSVIRVDEALPKKVLDQLLKVGPVKLARPIELP